MATVAGTAIMGTEPPLAEELKAFGEAIANGTDTELEEARSRLHNAAGGGARGDHAVYDAAAVVGFFASITKVVDLTGHYDPTLMKMLEKMGRVLSTARSVRTCSCLMAPFRSCRR